MTARTHCGNVERGVNRIRFELAKFFHTDIGNRKGAVRSEGTRNNIHAMEDESWESFRLH